MTTNSNPKIMICPECGLEVEASDPDAVRGARWWWHGICEVVRSEYDDYLESLHDEDSQGPWH